MGLSEKKLNLYIGEKRENYWSKGIIIIIKKKVSKQKKILQINGGKNLILNRKIRDCEDEQEHLKDMTVNNFILKSLTLQINVFTDNIKEK